MDYFQYLSNWRYKRSMIKMHFNCETTQENDPWMEVDIHYWNYIWHIDLQLIGLMINKIFSEETSFSNSNVNLKLGTALHGKTLLEWEIQLLRIIKQENVTWSTSSA